PWFPARISSLPANLFGILSCGSLKERLTRKFDSEISHNESFPEPDPEPAEITLGFLPRVAL
ncbi:MAG: hypothetical protein KGM92_18835, partial [Acidobacteriota bacterium]|nr:hypothetical protein [Acidobacteriota bacterium]